MTHYNGNGIILTGDITTLYVNLTISPTFKGFQMTLTFLILNLLVAGDVTSIACGVL